jgi:signal transduction histidine kinase
MFGRIRRLEISLAAKCQILFGAAVVLIIAAALLVPWQRMEQLTQQLDQRAAAALADDAVARHVALKWADGTPLVARNAGEPADAQPAADAPGDDEEDAKSPEPAARGARTARERGREKQPPPPPVPPRLIGTGSKLDVNRFERRALSHFARHRDDDPLYIYYERTDNTDGYRYARPLFLNESCAACHTVDPDGRLTTHAAGPVLAAAQRPTDASTRPADRAAATTRASDNKPYVGVVSVDMPSRIDANELLLNRVFILAAGLLAGTLAVVAFYLITTRLILQPVRVLQETAEKVSQGDLNIRSDISTGDEFQQLSETFNTMLANLKQNADQLRSVNKSLDLKLGQLAESNLALYESNRLKSEFLANVSHELRTPLNSILGFADLLKDALERGAASAGAGNGDAKSARYVNNILQSSRNLLELINDLLDLAKIEAGRMEIRSEPLSLSDVFEGLVNILKPLSEQKGLSIVTAASPDVPIIHSDPAKLQQVLYNFLSNAIKFSPAGSRIDLATTLEEGGEHVRISVTDRGPGIDPDKQQLIFEKFRQLEASHTRTHGGTGLGLAISKELALLLGGSIGVRSAPGEGSTFWLLLPLKIASGSMEMRGRLVLT